MENFQLSDSVPNFFVQLSNQFEEHAVKNVLSKSYSFEFFADKLTEQLTNSHDIAVIDWPSFNKNKATIKKLKEDTDPVFLPIILLVKEPVMQQLTDADWDLLNDVIIPPVTPNILSIRIRSLLNLRMQSLKLNRQNSLSNKALNSIATGVIITDAKQEDNPIIFCNAGFEETSGYPCDEVMGRNCRFLQGDDGDQEGVKRIREAVKEGRSERVLLKNYRKNGDLFWNELTISPIKDDNSENKYFIGVQNDVTSLVKAQTRLQSLLNEKSTLLKEVHHRIKNNLAVIVALLELKIMDSSNQHVIGVLNETKNRIFSIANVHELLYEHDNLHEIRFDTYIENLTDHLRSSYFETKNEIEFKLNLEKLSLNLNQAVPCGMLLSELITNAIKYAFVDQESGLITITLEETDNKEYLISVADNGRGVADNDNVFDKSSIVFILTKQLSADFEFNSDSGFVFEFSFVPLKYNGPSNKL